MHIRSASDHVQFTLCNGSEHFRDFSIPKSPILDGDPFRLCMVSTVGPAARRANSKCISCKYNKTSFSRVSSAHSNLSLEYGDGKKRTKRYEKEEGKGREKKRKKERKRERMKKGEGRKEDCGETVK